MIGRRRNAEPATPVAIDDSSHWALVITAVEHAVAQRHPAAARPHYLYGALHAARIARTLGLPRVSVLELGVAGGNGLIALEDAAAFTEETVGVGVDVHGFDTGGGLPPPADHRDAPYIMRAGDFPMDVEALRARLRGAELHLGNVRDTLREFQPASPVGFIAFDLDYYSSTRDALQLLTGPADRLLPRVLCYYDDVLGYPWGADNGPRLAMTEHNAAHPQRVLSHLPGMRWLVPPSESGSRWVEALWLGHVIDHPRYAEDEGTALVTRLDLTP